MTNLKDILYDNIGKIQHLRTFEFLKIIEQNRSPDGISRITYKRWKEEFGIHAFILNCCVEESKKLGLIETIREDRNGATKEASNGIRRVYRLLVDQENNQIDLPKKDPEIEPILRKSSRPLRKTKKKGSYRKAISAKNKKTFKGK